MNQRPLPASSLQQAETILNAAQTGSLRAIVERQILAVLRDQRFFSVGALNQAIVPLLNQINDRAFAGDRHVLDRQAEGGQLVAERDGSQYNGMIAGL